MVGILDVGGGLRGIYGAGVFDYCLEHDIVFDYCIGVSAGSANIVSYAAGQCGRNYHFFIDYSFRKEYMSLGNLIRRGSYLDMDYIYSTLYNAGGENPLDYPAVRGSGKTLRIVATSATTGRPVYFCQDDLKQDCYDIIKASCSIPVVNRPYPIAGDVYYDGGISDPIPMMKAFEDGCDRLVVILTKPLEHFGDDRKEHFFSYFIKKKYPAAAELLSHRNALYRTQIKQMQELILEKKVLAIIPRSIYGMKTLSRQKASLHRMYIDAQEDAKAITDFLN